MHVHTGVVVLALREALSVEGPQISLPRQADPIEWPQWEKAVLPRARPPRAAGRFATDI